MLLRAVDLCFGYGRRAGATRPGAGRRAGATRPGAGPRLAIEDVSLEIPRGALLGILGPNGSGKTTLLRLLAGSAVPQRGRVLLDGQDLRRRSRVEVARRIAVVPQETHLAFEYRVLEIALMGRYPHLRPFQVEGPADLDAALRALDATGTRELADRPFQTLSGGEKQRVIIASALAQLESRADAAPPLVFLDEPTASLDLHYQVQIAALVRDLHVRRGITVVLSTHDLHLAAALCRQVVLLRNGRILAQGDRGDVLTTGHVSALFDVDPSLVPAL